MVGSSGGLTEPKEVTVYEGELPCLLVYSDPKHVNYINEVLSVAEDVIRKQGFKPQRLTSEIRSGQDYFAKISYLIDSCALVLVILDGLRPNVVFEFGFAEAKGKPIIIIRSKGSVISVKTLYKAMNHSGLTDVEFEKLKDPLLDPTSHLSDFAGKHIPYQIRVIVYGKHTLNKPTLDKPGMTVHLNECGYYKSKCFENDGVFAFTSWKVPIGSKIKVCAVNVDTHDTHCGYGESHAKNGHGTEVIHVQLD